MKKNICIAIIISFFTISLQAYPKIYSSLNEELANFSSNCNTIQNSNIFPMSIQEQCERYSANLNDTFNYGEKLEEDPDALRKGSRSYLIKLREIEQDKSKLIFELVKLKKQAMKETNHKLYTSIIGIIDVNEIDYAYMRQHKNIYAENPIYQKQEAQKKMIKSNERLRRKEQLRLDRLDIEIATNIETAKNCEDLVLQLHDKASFDYKTKYELLENEYNQTLQTNFNIDQNKTTNYKNNEWAKSCILNKNPRIPDECFQSCRNVLSWKEKKQVEYEYIVSVYDDVFGAKECSPFTNPLNQHFPQQVTGAIDASGGPNGWVVSTSIRLTNKKRINVDITKNNSIYAPQAYFEKERGACSGALIPVSEEEYKRLTY